MSHLGCERDSSVSMWIYVFLGNVLRGIGETPVQPLGISYIDDYAQSENAALYIGNAPMYQCISFQWAQTHLVHTSAVVDWDWVMVTFLVMNFRMCPNHLSHRSGLRVPAGVAVRQDLCWHRLRGHGWVSCYLGDRWFQSERTKQTFGQ